MKDSAREILYGFCFLQEHYMRKWIDAFILCNFQIGSTIEKYKYRKGRILA